MNKINTFFYILKQSVTNINYYNVATKAKFSFLFKYVLLFSLIFGVIYNLIFANLYFQVSKNWPSLYSDFKEGLYQIYPTDLDVTVTDGTLTTNKPNPVLIKIPDKFKDMVYSIEPKLKNDNDFQKVVNEYNLAVIDTDAKVEEISKYKTFILFTKNSFSNISRGSTDNDIIYEFHQYQKDNKITKINQNAVNSIIDEGISTFEKSILPIIITICTIMLFSLWIILTILIVVINLFCHLFTSLWGFILAKLMKISYSYVQVYKLGMPLIPIFGLLSLINMFIHIPTLVFIEIALYTTIVLFVFNRYKDNTKTSRK